MNFENVPIELQRHPQWCVWRYEQKPNRKKPDKVPYNPLTAQRAESDNPKTFTSFDVVKRALTENSEYSGVGVGLFDSLAALDIDGCIDPATGQINELAQYAIATMKTYMEISPSGCGIRLFFYAPDFQYNKKRYYSYLT